jgi:HK97 family phage prohead protease
MAPDLRTTDGFEYRSSGSARLDLGSDGRRIHGHAIIFNALSHDLGGFIEQVAPEAVDRTLREAADVHALYNHDYGAVLGRTKSGTLRLEKDRRGLAVTIDPPDPTTPANLLELIRRGDVSGMSFRFRTLEDGWDFKTGPLPIRTLHDIEITEITVTPRPAYPSTDVAVRSLEHAVRSQGWHPSISFRERWLKVRR